MRVLSHDLGPWFKRPFNCFSASVVSYWPSCFHYFYCCSLWSLYVLCQVGGGRCFPQSGHPDASQWITGDSHLKGKKSLPGLSHMLWLGLLLDPLPWLCPLCWVGNVRPQGIWDPFSSFASLQENLLHWVCQTQCRRSVRLLTISVGWPPGWSAGPKVSGLLDVFRTISFCSGQAKSYWGGVLGHC